MQTYESSVNTKAQQDQYPGLLAPDHIPPRYWRELTVESAIDPAIIQRRGVYYESDPAKLQALGFASYQARPGLVYPEFSTAGVQVGHKLKPDDPRIDRKVDERTGEIKERVIKYESIAGRRPMIDAGPDNRDLLRNAEVSLVFTEGIKKRDSLASQGIGAVSISGTWAFMTERLVIPDFDDIALHGRLVYLCFDSDVMKKRSVREALQRLKEALKRRGARVMAVYLPDGPDGAKWGADDYFAHGYTVADFWQLAADMPDPDSTDGCLDELADRRIAELEATVDDITAELVEVKELNHLLIATISNPNIDGLGVAAVRTVMHVAHERKMGRAQADGSVKATARKIGDDNRPFDEHAPILPASTAYAHNKRLEKLGLIERKIQPAQVRMPKKIKSDDNTWQTVRDESGNIEYVDTVTDVTFLNVPGETINEMLRPIAFFAPPTDVVAPESQPKSKRGGDRRSAKFRTMKAAIESMPTCPHCGEDALTVVCTACHCTVSANDLANAAEAEDQTFKLETDTNQPEIERVFKDEALNTSRDAETPHIDPFKLETGVADEPEWLRDAPPDSIAGNWGRAKPMPKSSAPMTIPDFTAKMRGRGHVINSCRNIPQEAQA